MSVLNRLIFLIGLASCLIYQPLLAQVYKWVDENGVTQYSASPPPKGDFNKLNAPPPPADGTEDNVQRLQKQTELYNERREDKLKEAAKQKEADSKNAENAEKCAKVKENLAYFQAKARIRYTEADGSVAYLTEAQRQQRMQEMQKRIEAYCKK